MDVKTIGLVCAEMAEALKRRRFGKVFQLSKTSLAIDVHPSDGRYLFIAFSPPEPRVYLIKRRLKELERTSGNPSPFALLLRQRLANAIVLGVQQIENERVIVIRFEKDDEIEGPLEFDLVIQLSGRSANLFLLNGVIVSAARETKGEGQQPGDLYRPPVRTENTSIKGGGSSLPGIPPDDVSAALDRYFLEKQTEDQRNSAAKAALARLRSETRKVETLIEKLEGDLRTHGDATRWKNFGDLLLANAANAKRDGDHLTVTDYFADGTPEINIPADENDSPTQAAEKYFRRYTKARNAGVETAKRIADAKKQLAVLTEKKAELERAIEQNDEERLASFAALPKTTARPSASRSEKQKPSGSTRSFRSSDGFEILVGKKATDNDILTFKLAKPLDIWMHAADYPGSHVVIRNPDRKEVPPGTLIEAAQLAAIYSQGKKQPKAAVHYTHKKFVNKPRGAAPGKVSLASFKTILVEPKVPDL
ncbi:MAG: NFACT family protein [Acidobacteriota bacterium]